MRRDRSQRVRRPAVAVALVALVTGCGSTVAGVSGSPVATDGGLGVASSPGAASARGGGLTVPSAGALSAPQGGTVSGGIQVPGAATGAGMSGSGAGASGPAPVSKGPIKLGFIVTNVSNAGSYGINAGQSYSQRDMYDALIAAMNKAGGINGRKIQPVYAVTDTASANWSSDFQAACSTFTQDNHVAAVLGYIFVWLDNFETCLAQAGVPHLYGGYQPGDETAQRQYPTVFSTTNPTDEGHYLTMLSGAVSTGVLNQKTKLGVILDSCGHDDRAWPRSGAPYLAAHHITYETAQIGCSNGASDNGRIVAAIQNAELHFRTNGDNVVLVEGVPTIVFMDDAESQQWHPRYLMALQGGGLEGNAPNDQLANVHGFGWLPEVDVDLGNQPYPTTAAQRRCLGMLRSQGLKPQGYNDYFSAYVTCDALFLYADALRLTGGDTRAANVVTALERVAPHLAGAATYDGRLAVSNTSHGGPGLWRAWSWDTKCRCFSYTGQPHRTPAA